MNADQTIVNVTQQIRDANTAHVWGSVDGITIESVINGPAQQRSQLHIYNLPPALPGEINGMVHPDKALNGLITDIRKTGQFTGHAYETLLLTPRGGMIGAEKLLLIGLGDRT